MPGLRFLTAVTVSLVCFQASCSIRHVGSSRRQLMPKGAGTSKGNDDGGGCKDYVLLCARGTAEPQSGSMAYPKLVQEILAAVKNGKKREVIYKAGIDYIGGPAQGKAEAMKYLTGQMSSCPKQKYAFIGYSEGAMVMTQVISDPKLPAQSWVAAVMLGNPHKTSGAPQNQGVKTGKGLMPMGTMKLPQGLSEKVFDLCLPGDKICGGGTGSPTAHLSYQRNPGTQKAAQFVIARLKGEKGENQLSTGGPESKQPEGSKPGPSGLSGLGSGSLSAGMLPKTPPGGPKVPKLDMPGL